MQSEPAVEADPGEGLPSQVRRVPSQRRSRELVERVLATATALIEEKGSDAIRMSEVAERAGVSIGSLYRYFPDKAAIVRTLAERYNEQGQACVEAELVAVRSEEELEPALRRVVDGYYEMFLAEPVMRDIWWATKTDKSLQDADAADVEAHTAMLHRVLKRLRPGHDDGELGALALLTMQLVATTVRLAISVERSPGDRIVALFKRVVAADLLGALEGG